MDTTLTQRLQESAHSILDKIEGALSWTAEQAPLVVQEYLVWHFWSNLISSIIPLIISIASIIAVYKLSRPKGMKWAKRELEDNPLPILVWFVAFVSLILSSPYSVHHIEQCIKVKVAPRIIIIEKLSDIIK